jgi:hypothetical protein
MEPLVQTEMEESKNRGLIEWDHAAGVSVDTVAVVYPDFRTALRRVNLVLGVCCIAGAAKR